MAYIRITQIRKRVRVLAGDILGLAGPGQKISGIMPCTIIRPEDMADIILNRNTHPAWERGKTKMIYEFPKNLKLWDEYAESVQKPCGQTATFKRQQIFILLIGMKWIKVRWSVGNPGITMLKFPHSNKP